MNHSSAHYLYPLLQFIMQQSEFLNAQPHSGPEQQLMTLARMQSTLRHRRIEHLSFLETSTIQFPPIASVTLAFPSLQPHRSEVKNSPRRRRIAQLEKYIERYGERTSREEASRIIFASPLSNRIFFQKTLRGNLYSTLDHKPGKPVQGVPVSKSERQKNNMSLAPAKMMQQSEDFRLFKTKLLAELAAKAIKSTTKYGNLAEINPEQPANTRSTQKMQAKSKPKREHVNRLRMKGIRLEPQRYSPWRSEELEDQLVL